MAPVRIRTIYKLGLVAGLALAASSLAAPPGFASYERAKQACMGDAMRLCFSEIPSIARITACMRRNKANVSAGCRAVMDEMEGAAVAKARPVQPAAPKPPVVARTEQPAAARPVHAAPLAAKPAAPAPAVAAPIVHAKATPAKPVAAAPVEQRPVVAAPLESLAWPGARPAQSVPAEVVAAPAAAMAQTAAPETEPVQAVQPGQPAVAGPLESLAWFEKKAMQMAEAGPPPLPAAAAPAQAPVMAAAVEQPQAAAPRSQQSVPAVQPVAPVAPAPATAAKPVQMAIATPPNVVAPVNAHPVIARPARVAAPVRVAQRTARRHHVRTARAGYGYRGSDMDRAMAIAMPILASVMASW